MAAGRIVIPGWMPALTENGIPIPNVRAFFFLNGTTTLSTVYADEGLTTPLTNPVAANSAGQFPSIWADSSAVFSVSMDAPYGPPGQPFTFDGIVPSEPSDTALANKADTDGGNIGPDFINNAPYIQPIGPSPIARSVQSRLAEKISVNDYADGSTPGTKFNRAFFASGGARQRAVYVPPGTYQSDVAPNVGNVTKILDGKVNWTGTQGRNIAGNGKIVQFSGLDPDFEGETNFSDPFYVGPISRPGLVEYQIGANRAARYMATATMVGYAPAGLTGIIGISDTGTGASTAYTEGCIGIMALALNRKTTADIPTTGTGCYAIYAEAVRWPNAGRTHVIEIDNINWGDTVAVTPSQPFRHGTTTGIWAMNGGNPSGTMGPPNASSVCLMVGNNGARWNSGIVFHNIGLVERAGGFGEAIAFGVKHSLVQYNNSEVVVNRIDFDNSAAGTRVLFDNAGLKVQSVDGLSQRFFTGPDGFSFGPANAWMNYVASTSAFRIGDSVDPTINTTATDISLRRSTNIGGAVPSLRVVRLDGSANTVEIQGSNAGVPVLIRPTGSDTNIDLALNPKGTGRLRFGTHTTNADAPVTGYITIKDASGTERKLAVIA